MGKQDDEISAAEAAALLGVTTEETVHNYRRRGWLPARGERRGLRMRYWFDRAEVEALAQRLSAAPATE